MQSLLRTIFTEGNLIKAFQLEVMFDVPNKQKVKHNLDSVTFRFIAMLEQKKKGPADIRLMQKQAR